MTRITQLDSSLLLVIIRRSAMFLYLTSRLRQLARQVDTLRMKTVDSSSLSVFNRYINVKKLICRTWCLRCYPQLPSSLTSIAADHSCYCCLVIPLDSSKNLTSLTIDHRPVVPEGLPQSLTSLYLGRSPFRSETRLELPHLVSTNIVFREKDYNPNTDVPVSSLLDGTNTSITHAIVLHSASTQLLPLYKNLTKLSFCEGCRVETKDVATLSELTELRCEKLVGDWSDLGVLTKVHTVIAAIDSDVYLNESPPNLTHLSVSVTSSLATVRGSRPYCSKKYPPLLTLRLVVDTSCMMSYCRNSHLLSGS